MALYARQYATPFLLDTAIKSNTLYDFVNEIISADNERIVWEMYNSHRLALYGVDFREFKNNAMNSLSECSENNGLSLDKLIVKNYKIMSNFNPEVGEKH